MLLRAIQNGLSKEQKLYFDMGYQYHYGHLLHTSFGTASINHRVFTFMVCADSGGIEFSNAVRINLVP